MGTSEEEFDPDDKAMSRTAFGKQVVKKGLIIFVQNLEIQVIVELGLYFYGACKFVLQFLAAFQQGGGS